jgi:AcrR family transcriptional regulator
VTVKSQYPQVGEDASGIHRLPETARRTERPGQPGGRRDTNRREKVKTLVDAGVTLFLERGIEATTIDEIAAAAGVAKGSFYRYFESKEELTTFIFVEVSGLVHDAFTNCRNALAASTSFEEMNAAYENLGADLAKALLQYDREVLLYLQEARGPAQGARRPVRELSDEITAGAYSLTEVGRARGLLRPYASKVTAMAVIGAAERLIYGVLSGEDVGDPLDIPTTLSKLILDGIAAPGLARATS